MATALTNRICDRSRFFVSGAREDAAERKTRSASMPAQRPISCVPDTLEHYIKSVPESVRIAVESLDRLLKSKPGTVEGGQAN